VTSLLAHGIRLTLVLCYASVHALHDIWSDRAGEDSRHGVGGSRGSTIFADDGDGRSRSHCDGLDWDLEVERKPKRKKEISKLSLFRDEIDREGESRGFLTSIVGRRRRFGG
jgi:hypothetical protein